MVCGSENHLFTLPNKVGGAVHPQCAAVEYITYSGAPILVAQQLLDGADVLFPGSSKWVAKEWRKVWQLACFVTPASATARFTAF